MGPPHTKTRPRLTEKIRIDWIRIATEIELNYSFDAFVVLHGTDTMSYSSSALSFLLEDLGKTVVWPGSSVLTFLRLTLQPLSDSDRCSDTLVPTPKRRG